MAKRAPNDAMAEERAAALVADLQALRSEANRAGQARYGINIERALGISMAVLRPMARPHRRDHALALLLWRSGWHEARILAGLIDDPAQVTPAQADRWVADFDSWDLCDQVTALFARTPFAEAKIREWAEDEREFVRRAGFATLVWFTVHGKKVPDEALLPFLPLIERHSRDPRNFVRKAVNWALRQIGKRSRVLHEPALTLAEKLAASGDKTARWIGRDAVKELTGEKVRARLARLAGAEANSE